MHNCQTAHPGKTHRRRNRYLKRLTPIRVSTQPLMADDCVDKVKAATETKSGQVRRDYCDTTVSDTQSRPTHDACRVELAPASAMKNPVGWLKRKFAKKTG